MRTVDDSNSNGLTRRRLLAVTAGGGMAGLAGCLGGRGSESPDDDYVSEAFVFAATVRDDPSAVEQDYEPLASWIESETGVPTRVDSVPSNSAAIGALAAGHAHAAYLSGGPAWVGWREYGLEPLAVEVDESGRTSYTAAAWVRADGEIDSVADLNGVDSCHTGDLTGAGMLIPTAHLAHEGYVAFEPGDDVTAIRDAVDSFFGDPVIGGGYVGALECLSRGHGDVAFVRKSTPEEYCGGADAPDWCLDALSYELLVEFAQVPSHPIMASPASSVAEVELLEDALLALNDEPAGREILETIFDAHRLTAATSEDHLGPYGELIEILPGIEDHLVE